jgi:hypothetical protein
LEKKKKEKRKEMKTGLVLLKRHLVWNEVHGLSSCGD